MEINDIGTQLLYTTVPIYAQNDDKTLSTGTGRTDKWWERNPDEKECSGGADVDVFRIWKADTRDAGRICAGNICVWWRESGGGVEALKLWKFIGESLLSFRN